MPSALGLISAACDFPVSFPPIPRQVIFVVARLVNAVFRLCQGWFSFRRSHLLSPTSGGGTTDYAVDIFHHAIKKPHEPYVCFLGADTRLPMIMMSDVLKGINDFMHADASILKQRTYNLNGISFTPGEIAAAIAKRVPGFTIQYGLLPFPLSLYIYYMNHVPNLLCLRSIPTRVL